MFYINVRICFILFAHLLIYNFTEVFTTYAPMGKYCAVFGCRSGYKSTRQKTSKYEAEHISVSKSIDERKKWAAAIGRDVECFYGVNWDICD